jgi:hypothetical protein
MKNVTYAAKSLLMGDEAADLLVEYSALLADQRRADAVDALAYSGEGDAVTVKLLLGEGTPLMTESMSSSLPEPDNGAAVEYMREQMRLRAPVVALPLEQAPPYRFLDFEI